MTGEANYNIDGDFSWSGQMGLFSEDNTVTKVRLFEHELESFVADSSPDNRQVYEFCLLHGFVPSKANEVLKSMQKDGRIEVTDVSTHARARANAFYLSWDNYQVEPRARFSVGSKS